MPLNIKNPEADRLARELVALTGESITDAVIAAMQERVERERARRRGAAAQREIRRVRERYRALPLEDERTADEILGYDDYGLPT
ncbi:MAG TPA: type II toxin-antitoxin system VapB family antitoxin [Longimicrobiales bacterium]|nr:type II toxin-antitoxin system VapB family antitoxin [Longimicrobiales bacterium]